MSDTVGVLIDLDRPIWEQQAALLNFAMGFYLGEKCKYCLGVFDTLESLRDAVYVGDHRHEGVAHQACWDANNPPTQPGSPPAGG